MDSASGSDPQDGGFKPHRRRKNVVWMNEKGQRIEEAVIQIGRGYEI